MDTLIPALALIHTLGAVVGTFFTTYAEMYYTVASSDGVIDHHERKYLRNLYRGLKWGMAAVVVSGVALIVSEYLVAGASPTVYEGAFWMIQVLTFLILFMSWMLAKKKAAWWVGAAVVLSAWWAILFIDLGFFNAFSFIALAVMYFLYFCVVALKLALWRLWLWKPKKA